MLRVREVARPVAGLREGLPPVAAAQPRRSARLAALGALGVALGVGATVLTVSLVQAEDDAGIRAFHLQEAANREARRAQSAGYAPQAMARPTAYAPARSGWQIPLLQTAPDGRLAHPPVDLNPFRQRPATDPAAARSRRTPESRLAAMNDGSRTFCVRLCDGFHAPIGRLRGSADLPAHEALCQAMNPGIPVKVFRLSGGVSDIGEAQSADGKRYRSLPMAYAFETTKDAAACRPAIVQAGERRVSLLRDFTLRPGDSVVLDGKVRTFMGGSRFPYSPRDFRDFRAADLSKSQRREIDERVGISRLEAQARTVRRQMLLREASLHDDNLASDANERFVLRGTLDPVRRGPVRMISLIAD
ncbi:MULTISPECIES: DUF2865 domain-containing protein [Hyphomicrobiales]|jgi:hypothetical protein|uniref:DUF2865 domain-containing protein n=1 Tax=Bosea massiliensis TaxID=151419 RepID=A0ABW0PBD9_9HYPH|nr:MULTISPECIES: DUF2865 domain-containing protein [Hyphomicrobiales]